MSAGQNTRSGWVSLQFSKHWLLAANTALGLFIGLPYLAPLLAHANYSAPAQYIYWVYRLFCHQLPARSFFVFGHQAALCHRCTAIWATFFAGGLLYILVRHRLKPLPFRWWILALIPVGLDGGTQLVGPLYQILPGWWLTGFAIGLAAFLIAVLWGAKVSDWQFYLFVLCFPLGMTFVHATGPRESNWQLRTLTGAILGLAYVWLIFPLMEETFQDIWQNLTRANLDRTYAVEASDPLPASPWQGEEPDFPPGRGH